MRFAAVGTVPTRLRLPLPRRTGIDSPRRIRSSAIARSLTGLRAEVDGIAVESAARRCESQLACGADARGADVVDTSSNQSGQPALRFASRAIARSAEVAWLRSQ